MIEFPFLAGGSILDVQIMQDGILKVNNTTSTEKSSSNSIGKKRKIVEDEEVLTLRAERENFFEETNYYKTRTEYLKLKMKKVEYEISLLKNNLG